jgi:hypothetical protein
MVFEKGAEKMPLETQIVRNGEALSLHWGDFHIAAMALAAGFDAEMEPLSHPTKIYDLPPERFACYPDAAFPITGSLAFTLSSYPMLAKTPLNEGRYVLKSRHKFLDRADGEVLELLPGDLLIAQRTW